MAAAAATASRWLMKAAAATCRRTAATTTAAAAAAGPTTTASTSGLCFDLTPEQRALQELARNFAKTEMVPRAAEYDRSGAYPQDVFKKAWEAGLVNLHIPPAYGGLGLGGMEGVIASEELAWGDAGMMTAMEINSVAEMPLLLAGTEAQKREYLGRMTAAPVQAAYCVTEPGAGSDVAGVKTRARKVGDEWVLNGTKAWITNGGVANWYFVLARTGEAGEGAGSAFTAFIVERDAAGVAVGKKENMMGQRCSDTRGVSFTDVRLPATAVVGAPGKGFKIAMAAFDHTRPPVAAGAIGVARRAMDEARAYALTRTTMGRPIAEPQAVAFMLADAAAGIDAARLLTYRAAWLADAGRPNGRESAMAKLVAAEHANKVVYDALQIFGGAGFCEDFPIAKLARDARIYSIYEGTSQIQRMIISRALLASPTASLP